MKVLNPRSLGLACAAAALTTGLTLAGCAEQVDGAAAPNAADLSAYKTEAASSSAAATSSRRAAERQQAISANCTPFSATTGRGVTSYNEFVDAHDNNAPDYDAKRETAVDTLEGAATDVETTVNNTRSNLPTEYADKLTEYVNAARSLAAATGAMKYTAPVDALNNASKQVNDARNAVGEACPGR